MSIQHNERTNRTHKNRPRSIRTRTVVYADPLMFRSSDVAESFQQYVRHLAARRADRFVLHDGEPGLEELVREVPANPVQLQHPDEDRRGWKVANYADALLADTLDIAVDVDRVRTPWGPRPSMRQSELRAILVRGAERDAIAPALCAAEHALELGIDNVRIGHPRALAENRATSIEQDGAEPSGALHSGRWLDGSRSADALA